MKKYCKLLILSMAGLMVGCNGAPSVVGNISSTNGTSSIENQSSESKSSQEGTSSAKDSVYSEVSTSEYQPSFDSKIDSIYTEFDFIERLEYFIEHQAEIHTVSYAKRGYVKSYSATSLGTNEYQNYDYTFYNGPMMAGKAQYRKVTGREEYTIDDKSGYDFDMQSYAEDGYLLYVEKLPKGVNSRVSYTDISKNNRYNNLYTVYNTTRHIRDAQNAVDALNGTFSNWSKFDVEEPSYKTANGRVELTLKAKNDETKTLISEQYFTIALNEESGQLEDIKYGFCVYDSTLPVTSNDYYYSIADYTTSNITYGGRTDFTGVKLSEADTEYCYGTRQKLIDYSGFDDGILSDEQAQRVCGNLSAYAQGTTKSDISFTIPKFVNPQSGYYGVNDDGEYEVGGELTGDMTAELFNGDFVNVVGSGTYNHVEQGIVDKSYNYNKQIKADDEGIKIIEDFSDVIDSHKHTIEASDISDVDPYLGINSIYNPDAFYPMKFIGQYGINIDSYDPADDGVNEYSCSGTVTKSGNKLTGEITRFYHRNVWTPYRTFSVEFTIEDNFLTDYHFVESAYIETDSLKYNFEDNEYTFKNYKEEVTDFNGTILDEKNYTESTVEENKEGLYM